MASSKGREFIDYFEKDKGVHMIYDGQYLLLDDSTDIYKCAKSWIVLSPSPLMTNSGQRKQCLLKSYIYDDNKTYSATKRQMLRANNFIIPEIAKAFGLDAASYGRFKIIGDLDEGELAREENIAYTKDRIPHYRLEPNREYLLTPSFLKSDEEFVPFGDILSNDKETNVSTIWKQLEQFLTTRNISKENIKKVKKQYALKSIFGAFVELNDNHNYNDGLIFTDDRSNRSVRIAPAYDLDFSMQIYNVTSIGATYFIKTANNGRFEVTDMLKEFQDIISEKELTNLMSKIYPDRLTEIIDKTERKHGLQLTTDVEYTYYKFFREKYEEMEKFYRQRFGKDIED